MLVSGDVLGLGAFGRPADERLPVADVLLGAPNGVIISFDVFGDFFRGRNRNRRRVGGVSCLWSVVSCWWF